MTIRVDPSGVRVRIRALRSQLTRDLPISSMYCEFLFILLEDNSGGHTECLNIHVFSLKQKRNGIYRKLIDRPKIYKLERRSWVLASRQLFSNP